MKEKTIGTSVIKVIRGDITKQNTDAIVNAANNRLSPGGGVAGAIHGRAGPELWEECKLLDGCKTGEAKITKGYHLAASFVIHTVGPVYTGKKQDEVLLASCYRNSMKLALKHDLKSISFPAISAGIFGYPMEEVAKIALSTIEQVLRNSRAKMVVQLVLFDDHARSIFENSLHDLK